MKLLPVLAVEDPGVVKEMRLPFAAMATKEQNTSFAWVRRHRRKLTMSGSSYKMKLPPNSSVEDPGIVYKWGFPSISRHKHPDYGLRSSYDATKDDDSTGLEIGCTRLMDVIGILRLP